MKKHTVTQEILLLTTSSLAQGDLCNREHGNNHGKAVNPEERLEEACWNGMLDEFLEKASPNTKKVKVFLWKIYAADKFLCIEMSESPGELDHFYSLDPHLFLDLKNQS